MAFADFDGDGRLDLVISNNNAGPSLYMNRLNSAGNWVSLTLTGTNSNHSAVGARVHLKAGGKTLYRKVEAGLGFASQGPLNVHIGLGEASSIDALEIHWPNGLVETFNAGQLSNILNCSVAITEGTNRIDPCKQNKEEREEIVPVNAFSHEGMNP